MKTFGKALVVSLVGFGALVATGRLDVDVRWHDDVAQALDLFGDDEEEASDAPAVSAGPFWQEGSNAEPIAPRGVPGSFADLAERTSPGVVNISTKKTVVGHSLEEMFPFPFGREPFGRMQPRERMVPSLGSGFVISTDGHIVTNNHVIADVDSITVRFNDGIELPAEVVGRDPKTDIALIKVEAEKPIFALPLGDSESVRAGEWVVAIGNPFGLEHTVTAGIVSAKHRDIDHGAYDDYIQTDAAINPGNSGGPLINLRGEVIGINTAINPRANTIGFAVPVNMAKDILPQLRATGSVTRGWLGVVIQRVTPELAESFDLEDKAGALVSKVEPGGPADKAGVQRGDVVVEFNGEPIEEMEELPRVVAGTSVGTKAKVVVLRDGDRKTLDVEVGRFPDDPKLARAGEEEEPEEARAEAYGMRIQNLTEELAEQLGLDDASEGVVVTQVQRGSPAAEAGLRRGDVILEVDRKPVGDVKSFEERLGAAKKGALLLVRRGDNTLFMAMQKAEDE
ncbi:MAG: DegQ family serine endoprotease [Myxococcota bacterium]